MNIKKKEEVEEAINKMMGRRRITIIPDVCMMTPRNFAILTGMKDSNDIGIFIGDTIETK